MSRSSSVSTVPTKRINGDDQGSQSTSGPTAQARWSGGAMRGRRDSTDAGSGLAETEHDAGHGSRKGQPDRDQQRAVATLAGRTASAWG
jgi:hypothetical protein